LRPASLTALKANLTLDQFAAMIDALQAFLNEGKEPFDDPAFPLNWQPKPAGESGVEALLAITNSSQS
jgi:hypothetical protein